MKLKNRVLELFMISTMSSIAQGSIDNKFANQYLEDTPILNYLDTSIQALVKNKGWHHQEEVQKVKNIYNFVRDEILFGYNTSDTISASKVLADGYGQCNTKSTLLMALLRAVNVPNRIHGFTIDKELQKGAISGIWYKFAPQNILHSWVEVYVQGKWYFLEGVILDKSYLTKLQAKNKEFKSSFCGFGVYTDSFQNPDIDWDLNNTFIQKNGINQDFGLFNSPDEFYAKYSQNVGAFKRFLFKSIVMKKMNKNVRRIRNSK